MHESFRPSTTSSQDLQLAAQGSSQDTKNNLLQGDISRKAPSSRPVARNTFTYVPRPPLPAVRSQQSYLTLLQDGSNEEPQP